MKEDISQNPYRTKEKEREQDKHPQAGWKNTDVSDVLNRQAVSAAAKQAQIIPMNGFFITGTDTGVGKTLIAGALDRALSLQGSRVGVMKRFERGCRRDGDTLVPADAVFLRNMAGSKDDLALICPYAFERPLAPGIAARSEHVTINIEKVQTGAMLGLLIALGVVWLAQANDISLNESTFRWRVLISLAPAFLAVLVLAIGAKDVPVSGQAKLPKFASSLWGDLS